MAVLKIYLYGTPILRQKTTPIKQLPPDFERLLADMFDTMYDDDGIGLSANQVGQDLRFFIADFSLRDSSKLGKIVFINPEILEASGESTLEEGCLSVPDIRAEVTRPDHIRVRYQDQQLQSHEEEYGGFTARVIQHEIDHLDGIFFTDRVNPLKKSFIASKLKRIADKSHKTKREIDL
jgi:peptide deformylase